MNTPVVLIIFNRVRTTERALDAIRQVRPSRLFVIADGPRPGVQDDIEKCAATRKVIEGVDWECDLQTNFADHNLGCGMRPATGISWVFEQVDRAIFLEDDCVPDPSFFPFCTEMLDRYADDERVMMVSGNNFLPQGGELPYSYTFFRFLNLWGWASWRRAWRHYEFEMNRWPSARRSDWFASLFANERVLNYWREIFDHVYIRTSVRDVWDFQFAFALMAAGGLGIAPDRNLVSNIGFGADATHTTHDSDLANRTASEMPFPLKHPPEVVYDPTYDQRVFDTVFHSPRVSSPRFRARVKKAISEQVPVQLKRWWFQRHSDKAVRTA